MSVETIMKKLISLYNNPDTLMMITLYPKKGELYSRGTSGVASYAKNIARHMKRKVVVLADVISSPEAYEEDNVLVVRCFRRGSPLLWLQILKTMRSFGLVRNIHIQFDFAMYGHIFPTTSVLLFLGCLSLFGKKASVTLHHVIMDVRKISGHIGLGKSLKDSIKGKIYNSYFHIFYAFLGIFSQRVVVLEEPLKEKLERRIDRDKIEFIPHGVDTKVKLLTKSEARKRLGIPQNDYVIMFFGYVNWFKGADIFVSYFKEIDAILKRKVHCIVGGGISPTMKDEPFYQTYYQKVLNEIETAENFKITGYIPQNKIGYYFSASDLLVLPYRYFMTASGVLSLLFSYQKPFIVSDNFSEIFESNDFRSVFGEVGLRKRDFVFELNKKSCITMSENVLKNGIKNKIVNMTKIVREKRSYKNTAKMYEKVLSTNLWATKSHS